MKTSKQKRGGKNLDKLGASSRLSRLVERHFLSCSASAAGLVAATGDAAIHYSGVVNRSIPQNDNGGLFLDLDTGTFSIGTPVAGYDLNFFEQAGTHLLQLRQPVNGINGARGFTLSPYNYVSNLPLNTRVPPVGGSPVFVPYAILAAVDSNGTGASHGPWAAGVTGGFVGFRFVSAQNQTQYGWARLNVYAGLAPDGTGAVAVLVDYAYDDSGAPILAGQTVASPIVTTQPGAQTVFLGDLATFTAASDAAAATVQWQVSTNGGGLFSNIAGATAATFTLRPAASHSGDLYRAVFTNAAGPTISNAAALTVDALDSDLDGMPDHWEDTYGLNKNDSADAALNRDGDSMSNLQEFLASTDPLNPASVLRYTAFSAHSPIPAITFSTVAFKNYLIEKNDTLTNSAGWSFLALIAGTGGNVEFTDPTVGSAPAGRRYYRITAQPQP